MFTRQHYILIAATVQAITDKAIHLSIMNQWIQIFTIDNSRFDEDKFKAACY